MYHYDSIDRTFVAERVSQFRDQVARRLSGALTEEEFRPLRLTNGLYLQLHAYMLRVAIPYGTLDSRQLRMLAHIARVYDRGYGHFTTRQNLQFNWIKLDQAADALADLASVDMHALQTSGNCIRNVTADHWSGVAPDEVADPRVYAELIRQWSSLHPEFSFLPRKFKIAVTGSPADRAAARVHDIGLILKKNDLGEVGFEVIVGGGLGRTPLIGKTLRDFLPEADLLPYLEAVLRVYNIAGRRDNLYKARIKILVHEIGAAEMTRRVEAEFADNRTSVLADVADVADEVARISSYFSTLPYGPSDTAPVSYAGRRRTDPAFRRWVISNTFPHKMPGHTIVEISLKPIGGIPGDATAEQMDAVANLAAQYSHDELRVTHTQNLVLPHVQLADLTAVYDVLVRHKLDTPNVNQASDIIACPGLDYCSLANARSIPIAQRLSQRFGDLDQSADLGEIKIKISGCINACGHHHVGHIGLLGVDKNGEEFYQITLGGSEAADASLGTLLGPAISSEKVIDAVETLIQSYRQLRDPGERFLDTYRRLGAKPFKERVYAAQ
jgi:sulfite reductase (NADPH) hemoprotein beta-component